LKDANPVAALSVLAATTCCAPAVCGQTAVGDSGARPVILTFSYTGELVQNAGGGARRGTTFAGAAGGEFTLLLRRLVGWHGARIFVFALGTHGGAPSDLVGDVQGVSNLEAPAAVRLEEAWLQQNLLDNRLSWLVGRYDLNTEFYRLQSGALFINSSFGIGPEFAHSGVAGPSIFPNTAVGTRVDFKPSPNVVWRAAVLDGVPVDRPGDGTRVFASGDGALLVGEVALLARPDTVGVPRQRRFGIGRGRARPYGGKLAIGAWYYTARFSDLADTLPSGASVQHRGSGGVYLIGDLTVRSLTAFAQLGGGRWPREPDRRLPRRRIHLHRAVLESCTGRAGAGSGGRAEWIALRARAEGGRRPRGRGDQRGAHLPGAARLVADRAARRTIRDPSGGHTRDAECRGAGAAHRGIALNLGTGH